MSGIYLEITLHYFHEELCCVEKFCVLHLIALNHGMGLLHWNSTGKKYIKIEFQYTWHILSTYHVYTFAALHIHGIYMVYTNYIPHRGSRCTMPMYILVYIYSGLYVHVYTFHEKYVQVSTVTIMMPVYMGCLYLSIVHTRHIHGFRVQPETSWCIYTSPWR